MATKQLAAQDTYILPRVNLLPPEIAAKKAEQRSYLMMGVAVAGAAVAVGFIYMGEGSKVEAAKRDLAQTRTQGAKLQSDRAALQTVQDTYAAVDADEALLTLAYSNRINWSVQLHNLSVGIPENVWLTQFTGVSGGASAPGASGAPTAGTLTYAGKAFEYNDVAAWLDSLAKLKGVKDATFSTATKEKPVTPSGRALITFSSTASLTPVAITPHKIPGSK